MAKEDKAAAADTNTPSAEDQRIAEAQAQEAQEKAKIAKAAAADLAASATKLANDTVADGLYEAGDNAPPSEDAARGFAMNDDGSKAEIKATPKSVHSADAVVITGASAELMYLTRKAIEINIIVDPLWSVAELKGYIQQALEGRADLQVKGAVPTAAMQADDYDVATKKIKTGYDVVLQRDYFPTADIKDRQKAGNTVTVSRDEALRLTQAGVANLVQPVI